MPLEFSSVGEWCELIGNNLLAEFWHVYREASRGPGMSAVCTSESQLVVTMNAGAAAEGLIQHLLVVDRSLHLVTGQSDPSGETLTVTVKPALRGRGRVLCRSLGYIGSYVAELGALVELSQLSWREAEQFDVLQSILRPQVDLPGDYTSGAIPKGNMNPSQHTAVSALKFALEKVQRL